MNLDNHPCFNPNACKTHGRIHLPVAPRCNIQCNFCNRKFDCVNESRPGVSSSILKPFQAVAFLDKVMATNKNISVVGIAGPGDPFANPEETLATLGAAKEKYPDMLLCLASNGLNLPDYLDDIKRLDVTHVSITINAVDPKISEKIYSWVRYGKKSLSPQKGAALLLEKQLESIKGLKERGIIVKVNTIVLPGINEDHVPDIAKKMAEFGVDLFNCMPYYPNEGANFSDMKEPDASLIQELQKEAAKFIPQMRHCKRCRADAVGLLGEAPTQLLTDTLMECAQLEAIPALKPVNNKGHLVAVASKEGVLINQHLGEAKSLAVYALNTGAPQLVGRRNMPEAGLGDDRWQMMADQLKDCDRILVSGAGDRPTKILKHHGIEILMVEGLINDALTALSNKEDISHMGCQTPFICDRTCEGQGMGCM